MRCYLVSLPSSLMSSVRVALEEVGTSPQPSTLGWRDLENRSLDLLASLLLQLMQKTGLPTSRSCLRCWDVLTSLKLGWLATSLKVMLLVGGRLLNKPREEKFEREYHTIRQREGELTANAGRNIELLRERGGLNNKRNRDGDRIQSAARNNNQRGYDQRRSDGRGYDRQNNNQRSYDQRGNDGRSYDRQGGNSGQRSYQQNRDQQYNCSSGSSSQKGYTD
ncbi:hypothetical protein Tco_0952178 [Tanacetum coccineum]|uniref:Uncharacterized protein n=1 Tax=Tanacetum coccineum TaxID=301880 RepID=A0ABQ5DWW3_9ASTR